METQEPLAFAVHESRQVRARDGWPQGNGAKRSRGNQSRISEDEGGIGCSHRSD